MNINGLTFYNKKKVKNYKFFYENICTVLFFALSLQRSFKVHLWNNVFDDRCAGRPDLPPLRETLVLG